MRSGIFFLILAVSVPLAAQTYYYQRPTADVDGAASGQSCGSEYVSSSSMSGVYSGKSGVGPIGSGAVMGATDDSGSSSDTYKGRTFTTWQNFTGTVTTLTLNVTVGVTSNAYHGHGGDPSAYGWYSTDGGSTWVSLFSYTTISSAISETTLTASITGAVASSIQVTVCVDSPANASFTGTTSLRVYDIWTTEYGIPPASPSGFPGIIRSSFCGREHWADVRRYRGLRA